MPNVPFHFAERDEEIARHMEEGLPLAALEHVRRLAAAVKISEPVAIAGIGKTFLARAFGQKACRDGFSAYFATAAQLFREAR